MLTTKDLSTDFTLTNIQTELTKSTIPISATAHLSVKTSYLTSNQISTTDEETTEKYKTSSTSSTTTNSPYLIMEFCPGVGAFINCSATNDFVYVVDAFYGVSDQDPVVCSYK